MRGELLFLWPFEIFLVQKEVGKGDNQCFNMDEETVIQEESLILTVEDPVEAFLCHLVQDGYFPVISSPSPLSFWNF